MTGYFCYCCHDQCHNSKKDQLVKQYTPSGPSISVVVLTDLINAFFLILVLFSPRYHFTTTAFFTGVFIHFDIGLFRVNVSGNPKGLISGLQPASLTKKLEEAIRYLNGKSLAEFESYVCISSGFFLSYIPASCASVTALRLASILFILLYIMSAISLCAAAAVLAVAFLGQDVYQDATLRISYFLHIVPSFLAFLACFSYICIGGLDVNFVTDVPFVVYDANFIDIGLGYFLAVAVASLSLVNPLFAYFVLFRHSAPTLKQHFNQMYISEGEALLHEMRRARAANHNSPCFFHQVCTTC